MWFLEFVDILKIFLSNSWYISYFFWKGSIVIIAFVFQTRSTFFTVNYLVDNLPRNINVSKSKFNQVIFKLTLCSIKTIGPQ